MPSRNDRIFRSFRTTASRRRKGCTAALQDCESVKSIVLYNVPSRTVADLANDTTARLAEIPGIVGLKDATSDMARAADLLKRLPARFALYSGNDDTALALMLLGGQGVISVTANVAPRQDEMCKGGARRRSRARTINNQ
jgi:4-hydroxy-tetrahydrodipicolinate synthase